MNKKLQKFYNKHAKTLWGIVVLASIPIAGYYTLVESLQLSLPGDDWLLLYTIRQVFEVNKSLSYFDPSSYLCTYCPHYLTMSIVKYFASYNPYYYYLVSIFTKILGGYAIYFAAFTFTKRKLTALTASLFYVVSYIGIQTTDWVFNFNHYLGVASAAMFFAFYWKLGRKESKRNALLAALFLALSLFISPPRMHGIIPTLVIFEMSWKFFGNNWSAKRAIKRIFFVILIYLAFFSVGGYGTSGYAITIKKNLLDSFAQLRDGKTELLFNPIATVGNYILPDLLYKQIPFETIKYLGKSPLTFFTHILPIGLVFIVITAPIVYLLSNKKRALIYIFLILAGTIITRYIKFVNLPAITSEKVTYIEVGMLSLFLSIYLPFVAKEKYKNLSQIFFASYFWMITFSLFPLALAPYLHLPSSFRYSVHQSAALSLWLAIFLTYMWHAVQKLRLSKLWVLSIVAIPTISIFIMQIDFAKTYINTALSYRNASLDQKLWDELIKEIPNISKDTPSVFYMEYDNYYIAEEVFRFGFSSRGALVYDITKQNANPFVIYEYDDLVSIVTDGKALVKQGRDPNPISLENVYALKIENGELYNITSDIRNKLQEETIE